MLATKPNPQTFTFPQPNPVPLPKPTPPQLPSIEQVIEALKNVIKYVENVETLKNNTLQQIYTQIQQIERDLKND